MFISKAAKEINKKHLETLFDAFNEWFKAVHRTLKKNKKEILYIRFLPTLILLCLNQGHI